LQPEYLLSFFLILIFFFKTSRRNVIKKIPEVIILDEENPNQIDLDRLYNQTALPELEAVFFFFFNLLSLHFSQEKIKRFLETYFTTIGYPPLLPDGNTVDFMVLARGFAQTEYPSCPMPPLKKISIHISSLFGSLLRKYSLHVSMLLDILKTKFVCKQIADGNQDYTSSFESGKLVLNSHDQAILWEYISSTKTDAQNLKNKWMCSILYAVSALQPDHALTRPVASFYEYVFKRSLLFFTCTHFPNTYYF